MSVFFVLILIALSIVFAVAGVTKLLDQQGTRSAVKNFGAPESLAPLIALVLPFIEIAIAVGLLFSATARVSASAALILLILFIIAISINLARGKTHDCHCFGQLYSRPLGWSTLLRNVCFALAAVYVIWQTTNQSAHNLPAVLAQLGSARWFLLLAAAAGVTLFLIKYKRKLRAEETEISTAPQGLPLNSAAPPFELAAYEGGRKSLTELLDFGKPLLLIFTNPHCWPCVALFKEIKEWQHTHSEKLTIALISQGTVKENFVNVARNKLGQVLLQEKREIAMQYGARVTPTAVLVNPDGSIGSSVAAGADEIRELLDNVLRNGNQRSDE